MTGVGGQLHSSEKLLIVSVLFMLFVFSFVLSLFLLSLLFLLL
jgi:hypothetical protein